MNTKQLSDLIIKIGKRIEEKKDFLTELDGPIGDSDHGINMARGFAALETKINASEIADIGTLLKTCGMTLVSQVGGSSGPLYGTAFMNAGKALAGKGELAVADFPVILQAAVEGVQMRGNATVGEATMVDAMVPASSEASRAVAEGLSAKDVALKVYEAAEAGAQSTIPMVATKGRASYVGERGIGHEDPGAASFALMMGVIAEEL